MIHTKNSKRAATAMLFAIAALPLDSKLMKVVSKCTSVPNSKNVYIVKQWHLPPSTNTKDVEAAKKLPQASNQKEIYDQFSAWISHDELDTVFAEGCEGEFSESTRESFQGWSYSDLSAHSKDDGYASLLGHPVMKLKAKYPKTVHAVCGDNLSEIKRSQMALSDARADIGYLTRLTEKARDPAQLKIYLDGVVDVYQLPKSATLDDAKKALSSDLRKSLSIFHESTHARDLAFANKIETAKSEKPIAVVIGGLHAEDLRKLLEAEKLNCEVLEPASYKNEEEALQKSLDDLLSE